MKTKATPATICKGDTVLWINPDGTVDCEHYGTVVDADPRSDEEPNKSYGGTLVDVQWGEDNNGKCPDGHGDRFLSFENTSRLMIVT